jgi:hypothetical protein
VGFPFHSSFVSRIVRLGRCHSVILPVGHAVFQFG